MASSLVKAGSSSIVLFTLPDVLNNYCYIPLLYISITTSMYLALSVYLLFISPMQSVNGAQMFIWIVSFLCCN